MNDDFDEHALLEELADPLIAAGMRLATPEETQALLDHAVAHVREQEELIERTPLERTVDGTPELPPSELSMAAQLELIAQAIEAMLRDVTDPSVAYGPNRDRYGKCVEVMWRAGYLAMETVARHFGVTGFQHGAAAFELFGKLQHYEGPFLVLPLERALYPQSADFHERVDGVLTEYAPWLAEQARQKLSEAGDSAHPNVVAHWRKLARRGVGVDGFPEDLP